MRVWSLAALVVAATAQGAAAGEFVVRAQDIDDRKAVMAAVDKIEVLQRKLQREEDQQVQEKCRTNGIEIHQFSAQDRAKLFKACEPLYSEYINLHGRELLDEIKKNQGQASAPENSIP